MKKNIEKALKEFLMDIRITGEERKKGIPLITFVYKEEDKAVLLKALPLPGGLFQGRGSKGFLRRTAGNKGIRFFFNAA